MESRNTWPFNYCWCTIRPNHPRLSCLSANHQLCIPGRMVFYLKMIYSTSHEIWTKLAVPVQNLYTIWKIHEVNTLWVYNAICKLFCLLYSIQILFSLSFCHVDISNFYWMTKIFGADAMIWLFLLILANTLVYDTKVQTIYSAKVHPIK